MRTKMKSHTIHTGNQNRTVAIASQIPVRPKKYRTAKVMQSAMNADNHSWLSECCSWALQLGQTIGLRERISVFRRMPPQHGHFKVGHFISSTLTPSPATTLAGGPAFFSFLRGEDSSRVGRCKGNRLAVLIFEQDEMWVPHPLRLGLPPQRTNSRRAGDPGPLAAKGGKCGRLQRVLVLLSSAAKAGAFPSIQDAGLKASTTSLEAWDR